MLKIEPLFNVGLCIVGHISRVMKQSSPSGYSGVFKVIFQATMAMLFSPGYRFLSTTFSSSLSKTSSMQWKMSLSLGCLQPGRLERANLMSKRASYTSFCPSNPQQQNIEFKKFKPNKSDQKCTRKPSAVKVITGFKMMS